MQVDLLRTSRHYVQTKRHSGDIAGDCHVARGRVGGFEIEGPRGIGTRGSGREDECIAADSTSYVGICPQEDCRFLGPRQSLGD